MDTVLLSDLERFYLIQGIEVGCRMDGRGPSEYRPLEIETDILSHATGSASIRIGETFIVCCVKMEVGKPSLTRLNEGRIEINVECYPTATYRCNEKGASELAERLKTTLQSTYQSEFINLNSLCIQRGRQCWVIYIDLLILEGAGNLLDASSLVIKAALLNATYVILLLKLEIFLGNQIPFYHLFFEMIRILPIQRSKIVMKICCRCLLQYIK
ncbi:Exosome complex exonuclease RRP42 [Schistosoma japonicum]|nr:Exosome complex exonuclease RRP42 [Schistosoma japonicum]